MCVAFIASFATAAFAPGCTWKSRVPRGRPITLPEKAPREIRTLRLCEPVSALLDCSARERECNHWYRVDVLEPGELQVRLRLGESEGSGQLTRLVVRPLGKPIVGQQVSNQGEPVEVRARVGPDLYGVLVQGGGARRSYELEAVLQPDGAAGEPCEPPAPDPSPDEARDRGR